MVRTMLRSFRFRLAAVILAALVVMTLAGVTTVILDGLWAAWEEYGFVAVLAAPVLVVAGLCRASAWLAPKTYHVR